MWGAPPPETIGSLFPNEPDDFVRIFGAVWRWDDIGVLVVTLVVQRLAVPAVRQDQDRPGDAGGGQQPGVGQARRRPDEAGPRRLVGFAGALAALAGVMVAGAQAQVTPIMMFTIFVYASAAATLGGLDSPIGAVVAGLSIGVVENVAAEFAPGWVGQEMKLAVALLCIFVVLLVRPSGLFGTAKVERV